MKSAGKDEKAVPSNILPFPETQEDSTLIKTIGWISAGKTDWEISRILGISQETVVHHLKQARERYGTAKRTSLIILALLDRTISLQDVGNAGHPPFWG